MKHEKYCGKKPRWEACLVWPITYKCNFNCEFCFVSKIDRKKGKIEKIKIKDLIKTLDKTRKTFLILFTGGEPFLVPNFIKSCKEITKKHYISLNTNLTSLKIKEFTKKIDPERVYRIDATAHLKEMEKYKLFSIYIKNFYYLKKQGFKIRAQEVAYPPLIKDAIKYRKFFRKRRIKLIFTTFVGKYKDKCYPKSYTEKEIQAFRLSKKDIKKHYTKGRICNAGYNFFVVYPNGKICACFNINNKLGNVYKEINFNKDLLRCPGKVCSCMPENVDPLNLERVLKLNFANYLKIYFLYILNKIILRTSWLKGQVGLFIKKINSKLYSSLKKIKK